MRGVVKNVEFAFGFITGQDGQAYFANAQFMPQDELGRRYLLPGEEVDFRPQPPYRGKSPQAIEIRLVTPRAPFEGYYEEQGAVRTVGDSGEYCFVERPFGGIAMLHRRRVRECLLRDMDNRPVFEPGQLWTFEIVKPQDPSRPWLAHNARES